jgi:glutamate--cysteine ligase
MRFMDTFLLYCLLEESPACTAEEQVAQAANLEAIVNSGRLPGLLLNNGRAEIPMAQWAREMLNEMRPIAMLLDTTHQSANYTASLENQLAKVADPELTPSARVLREMRERNLSFFRLAMTYSEQWAQYFRERPLARDIQIDFEAETGRSLLAQHEIEQSDDISFAQYLDNFFTQYQTL